jgi:hypothetical protein
MTTVGYLEGTDPLTLTRLNLRGIATLPLGNGFDGHGKNIAHLTKRDLVTVVGYLHKVLPTPTTNLTAKDFLIACHTHNIPVLLIVPTAEHHLARQCLGEAADWATLVDPSELYDRIATLCE